MGGLEMRPKTEEKIIKMIDWEIKGSHVDGSGVRKAFLEILLSKYGKDSEFDNIVDTQFSLFVDGVSSRDFVSTCNSVHHLIRNRLIAWSINHPEEEENDS